MGGIYTNVPPSRRYAPDDVDLQAVCWGVRNMRKFQLSNVESPNVEIEVGGQIVRSKVIKNAARNPNFDDPLLFFDIVSSFCTFFSYVWDK